MSTIMKELLDNLKLVAMLPKKPFDYVDLFVTSLFNFDDCAIEKDFNQNQGQLTMRQLRHKPQQIDKML